MQNICKLHNLSIFLQMGFIIILDLTPIQYLDMEAQPEKISWLMLWPWNFETSKLWNFEIFFFVFANSHWIVCHQKELVGQNVSSSSNILQCWDKDPKSEATVCEGRLENLGFRIAKWPPSQTCDHSKRSLCGQCAQCTINNQHGRRQKRKSRSERLLCT